MLSGFREEIESATVASYVTVSYDMPRRGLLKVSRTFYCLLVDFTTACMSLGLYSILTSDSGIVDADCAHPWALNAR